MPSVETKPVLNSQELKIAQGLSPQDQAIILARIEQGQRLAEILKPFSDTQDNILIPITREVQRGPVQTVPETQEFKLHGLRRVTVGIDATLRSYGLREAARTIFKSPSQTNNAV